MARQNRTSEEIPRYLCDPGANQLQHSHFAPRCLWPEYIQKYFLVLSDLLAKLLISTTWTKGLPHAIKIISFIGF